MVIGLTYHTGLIITGVKFNFMMFYLALHSKSCVFCGLFWAKKLRTPLLVSSNSTFLMLLHNVSMRAKKTLMKRQINEVILKEAKTNLSQVCN